jgi:molybdate transport system ATP-binding protein
LAERRGLHGDFCVKKGEFTLKTGTFSLPENGVTAVFGHSGSGKTTFIRALAGFEKAFSGELWFDGQRWQKDSKRLLTHKRRLGFVFQEASLFAHLSVTENLRYGEKRAKRRGVCAKVDFTTVVEKLGLAALLDRSVQNLSGGERQRVAIGRALLSQPEILLMDEPLSALDVQAKAQILPYLEQLRDWLNIPIVYITHSPEEVERLADAVLWLAQGKIKALESIVDFLQRADCPLLNAPSPQSVLPAKIVAHDKQDGLTEVIVGRHRLHLPKIQLPEGHAVRVVVSAKQVSLMAEPPERSSILNVLPATILEIMPYDDSANLIRLQLDGVDWPLLALITRRSCRQLNLAKGQRWQAALKAVSWLR